MQLLFDEIKSLLDAIVNIKIIIFVNMIFKVALKFFVFYMVLDY